MDVYGAASPLFSSDVLEITVESAVAARTFRAAPRRGRCGSLPRRCVRPVIMGRMSAKERLHELIEEMHDDQAAVLLMDLERPMPPLTAEDIASIERWADAGSLGPSGPPTNFERLRLAVKVGWTPRPRTHCWST